MLLSFLISSTYLFTSIDTKGNNGIFCSAAVSIARVNQCIILFRVSFSLAPFPVKKEKVLLIIKFSFRSEFLVVIFSIIRFSLNLLLFAHFSLKRAPNLRLFFLHPEEWVQDFPLFFFDISPVHSCIRSSKYLEKVVKLS